MNIGFIGLGNMGAPMARNLVAAGHTVAGFDTAGVTVDGVEPVNRVRDAVHGAALVVTMLPNGEILRSVYDAVIPHADAGCCLLDCSTVDVKSARETQVLAGASGLLSLDAPVSGGVGGAETGSLTFMVGGSPQAFDAAKPLLEVMGKKIVHCGDSGAGQAAKICNNMLLAVSMIGTCEAIHLADQLGLDRQKLFDVVSTASGSCWSMNTYCPAPGIGPVSPADNDYQPGFAAALMLKDLGLSQEAAQQVAATTPLGAHAAALYQTMVDDGEGEMDFSAVLQRLEKGRIEP